MAETTRPISSTTGRDGRTIRSFELAARPKLHFEERGAAEPALRANDGGLSAIRSGLATPGLRDAEPRYAPDRLDELIAERTAELEARALQLSEALERERKYNALLEQFIATVSHEFRTPLAVIDSAAQRLLRHRDRIIVEELAERASKIRGAVKRLVRLIDDTLSLSRMQAGRLAPRRRSVDLRALVAEACEQQQQLAGKHQIVASLRDLPARLEIDPDLMRQVFANLLSNAVKYSPNGGQIEVTGEVDEGFAAVAVRDYGLGIPARDLPQLFERFFRASNVGGIAGSGLGLSLCRHLVEEHGGKLTVDSVEGQGATFTLRLPLVVGEAGQALADAPLQVAE